MLLRSLMLPSFVAFHQEIATTAEQQGWTFCQYLNHLAELELADRHRRRIQRQLKSSRLPVGKTLPVLETDRFPAKLQRQLAALCTGDFVKRAENVLAFGLPGRGKTHLVCAVGHELIQRGYSVYFTPTYQLVQRLLAARRDLALEKELRGLDRFDVVILDDLGYIQQDRDEMEVLFTFLGERYERRSVMITSNLVFSQWDRIFKDPMTTAAAIDRLVHHALILEMTGSSYRTDEAMKRTTKTGECNDRREDTSLGLANPEIPAGNGEV
jgi:DNA replication protein DnaC